ncbi:hypothetical protein KM427_23110 [Nocardioides sp. LMS-CY]|uniref:hypothetical protein n=1 Tax=Nocardioides sp. (strain LMS-CY) TaxID=2840457 RepID=UPI001C00574B|nr:hypothetical protein [Nocardioides sp. LMS-CY]QWF21779.1 hypothetical protein KM427_23110 [Nocardioides sp. LMS-CY]
MSTLAPPRAEPETTAAPNLGDEPEADPADERLCECPNDHTTERRAWKRLVRHRDDNSDDACPEAARWWTRVTYECGCVDVLALCTHCLDTWLDDSYVTVTVLGQASGPLGPGDWPGGSSGTA